jgi:hypothetical protein
MHKFIKGKTVQQQTMIKTEEKNRFRQISRLLSIIIKSY